MTKERDKSLPDGEKLALYLDKEIRQGTVESFSVMHFYNDIINNPAEFERWKMMWCRDFIQNSFRRPPVKDQKRKAKRILKKFEDIKSNPPEGEFNIIREIINNVTLDDVLKSFDHDFAFVGNLIKTHETGSPLFQLGALSTTIVQAKKNVVKMAIVIANDRKRSN